MLFVQTNSEKLDWLHVETGVRKRLHHVPLLFCIDIDWVMRNMHTKINEQV
jgi:hypothetical protein